MSYIQVVGDGQFDVSPSLLVFFEHRKFLINCGEATQRYLIEHKVDY